MIGRANLVQLVFGRFESFVEVAPLLQFGCAYRATEPGINMAIFRAGLDRLNKLLQRRLCRVGQVVLPLNARSVVP